MGEAMQEELLKFKLQKVWILVDLPKGHRAIGTKWVYRYKKDKRGIVHQNKARLVVKDILKEEGIVYDGSLCPVQQSKTGFFNRQDKICHEDFEESLTTRCDVCLYFHIFGKMPLVKDGRCCLMLMNIFIDSMLGSMMYFYSNPGASYHVLQCVHVQAFRFLPKSSLSLAVMRNL
ncbi:putative ribonuclease H-like domain-containing protein [Tanacetum coccineum]|uniref:Ribonuclease H-like domain-containing protein n=1 Tax=Tanacetum coccineum TaxID=301880 RepID=A0ABQ5D3U4_9ASTR